MPLAGLGAVHGCIQIVGAGVVDVGKDFTGGRVHHLERVAAAGGNIAAADVQQLVVETWHDKPPVGRSPQRRHLSG